MKHLLFFLESLSGGGAEKVLISLLRQLDRQKYVITLVTLVDTGILKEDLDLGTIEYLSVIRPSSNPLVALWNKMKYRLIYHCLPPRIVGKWILPQKHIDLYVAFTEGFATKLLASAPGPKVAWVHIDLKVYPWTQDKRVFRNIQEEKSAYQRFDSVVCVSDSVEKSMILHYGLTNTRTILNPINSAEIKAKAALDCEVKLPDNQFRIVSVGRLCHQKGFDRLIPLIGRLRDRCLDVSLYLIGEGDDRALLQKITERNHVEALVHFLGYQKNPYPLMSQMDLFVCSSRAEGYSLAIAEALILGLPVISMNCSGPDRLLGAGEYGALCDDYDDLYCEIEKAVTDRGYLNQLKEKARLRSDFFNLKATIRQIEDLFDNTICHPSAS